MIEIEYVWDDRWDAIFHDIFQDGLESKRRGDFDGAVDIYFHNLEKYLKRNMLPVFPYAILLKALGKVLTLQSRYTQASEAYFFAIDIFVYQNIQHEVKSSLFHWGSCDRAFLNTITGIKYLSALQYGGGISSGQSDSFINFKQMSFLTTQGIKKYREFHDCLYKGREMIEGRDRDQEIRFFVKGWIERFRNWVPAK